MNIYTAAFLQDGEGHDIGPDSAYRGTIVFSSTDPFATLPAAYTFGSADGGTKAFTGVILRTPGPQTITGTDSVNELSGSVTLVVTGTASVSVPVLSTGMKALSVLLLAMTGIWFARMRR
jgi:hypothetical protein